MTTCCKCNQPIEILNPVAQALVDQGFLIQCQSCMRGILLPEKPTRYPWEDAPDEAVAAATDADGYAYWHKETPRHKDHYWYGGTLATIGDNFPTDDWQNSLEMRPTK